MKKHIKKCMLLAMTVSCFSVAQEAEVVPAPESASIEAPQPITADKEVDEKQAIEFGAAKNDPLYKAIYDAKLAKVLAIEAEAKKTAAVANAETKRLDDNAKAQAIMLAAPVQPQMAQPMQPTEPAASEQAPVIKKNSGAKKVYDEPFPKIKVGMISGETAKVEIDGTPSEITVGSDIKGQTVVRVDADSQQVTLKSKSGKTKNYFMDTSGPYPSSTIKPLTKKDGQEKQAK